MGGIHGILMERNIVTMVSVHVMESLSFIGPMGDLGNLDVSSAGWRRWTQSD